jgi:hypothetical protein
VAFCAVTPCGLVGRYCRPSAGGMEVHGSPRTFASTYQTVRCHTAISHCLRTKRAVWLHQVRTLASCQKQPRDLTLETCLTPHKYRNTGCPFCRVPDHGSSITQKACICYDSCRAQEDDKRYTLYKSQRTTTVRLPT